LAAGEVRMALEDWWKLNDKDLVKLRYDVTSTNPEAPTVDHIIRLRIAEREAKGSAALTRATDKLVNATWVLGALTVLLVIAAGIQAYPIFKREEDVGQRIRRECEAIASQLAAVPGGLDAVGTRREVVVQCLRDSARGRR